MEQKFYEIIGELFCRLKLLTEEKQAMDSQIEKLKAENVRLGLALSRKDKDELQ